MLKRLLLLLLLCAAGLAGAADDDNASREFQLKTAYLFHFAELAEWPAASQVTICLQGNSPLRAYLPILEGQHIGNRVVHVDLTDNQSFAHCQILFISNLVVLSNTLRNLAIQQQILLVSDSEDFARLGGMIQFSLRDNRLKLVINLNAVRQARIQLSSKLLRMAEILE